MIISSIITGSSVRRGLVNVATRACNFNVHFFAVRGAVGIVNGTTPRRGVFLVYHAPRAMHGLMRNNVSLGSIGINGVRFSRKGGRVDDGICISSRSLTSLHFVGRHNIGIFVRSIPNSRGRRVPSWVWGHLGVNLEWWGYVGWPCFESCP